MNERLDEGKGVLCSSILEPSTIAHEDWIRITYIILDYVTRNLVDFHH